MPFLLLGGAVLLGLLAFLLSDSASAATLEESPQSPAIPDYGKLPDSFEGFPIDFGNLVTEITNIGDTFIPQNPVTEPVDNFDLLNLFGLNSPMPQPTQNPDANVTAFLALIRSVESRNNYNVIAGGDTFTDFSEHPFILNPSRKRPLGTTASGAYQMVVGTWKMARDALGLKDFSPASQDAAAVWILQVKRRSAYPLVTRGDFQGAIQSLRGEWEAFAKMLDGTYPTTLAMASQIYANNGGTFA